ncbi:MAG: hypothetical protein CL613_06075 [Aquimarina sp.]|nr:hypothetical protein [Aquimarina sp.]
MNEKKEFPQDFCKYLKSHTLIGIKGGEEPRSFLDIWMVEVNGRIFARSWNKSKRSWFTAFVDTGSGQIKYRDKIIGVKGVKLNPGNKIQSDIDAAYLSKYTQPENLSYAEGISQPEYYDYTMEFIPKV